MNDLQRLKKVVLDETIKLSDTEIDDAFAKTEISKSKAITTGAKTYLSVMSMEMKVKSELKDEKKA